MRLIPLTQGKFAQVDDWNYNWLNQWKWTAAKDKNTYYAYRKDEQNPKNNIRLHRLIMNTPANMDVDHRDHNGLNCQEYNMRNCTTSQNCMNRKSRGVSKYLGVSKRKHRDLYVSQIMHEKKIIILGYFKNEIDAAKAYNIGAKKYHGEFANLNIINNE